MVSAFCQARDIAEHGADCGFRCITYTSGMVCIFDRFEDEKSLSVRPMRSARPEFRPRQCEADIVKVIVSCPQLARTFRQSRKLARAGLSEPYKQNSEIEYISAC